MLPCIQSVMLLAKTCLVFFVLGWGGTFNIFISSMNCVSQPLMLFQLLTEWIGQISWPNYNY